MGKGEGKQTAKEREVRYIDMEDVALNIDQKRIQASYHARV